MPKEIPPSDQTNFVRNSIEPHFWRIILVLWWNLLVPHQCMWRIFLFPKIPFESSLWYGWVLSMKQNLPILSLTVLNDPEPYVTAIVPQSNTGHSVCLEYKGAGCRKPCKRIVRLAKCQISLPIRAVLTESLFGAKASSGQRRF